MTDTERLWNVEELSEYLQVPVSSIYKMTAPKSRTTIPHMRLSGRIRFRKSDIDRWLGLLTVSGISALQEVSRRTSRKDNYGKTPQEETA